MDKLLTTDVLVIGSGIAGGCAALELADSGVDVLMITRNEDPLESNTYYAQGGIMWPGAGGTAADGSPDTRQLAEEDVIAAGHGHSLPDAVHIMSSVGQVEVPRVLVERLGIQFDADAEGNLLLAREAAHSAPRILHAADSTGALIQRALIKALEAHPNVRLMWSITAVDLLTPAHHSSNSLAVYDRINCVGAYLFDSRKQQVLRCYAQKTILATGGLGRLYLRTTNPSGARGDGIAMAYRAGARVINSEFVQFHPTTFHHQHAPNFLISEAVRGAGARLVDSHGRSFMQKFDPEWGDLAPRDVVSRGIHQQMLATGTEHVFLDAASTIPTEDIRRGFPSIYESCLEYGVDMTRDPIPVVPAAHYSCGGVWVDSWGRTTIENLYAVGEVACSGVHGANRLASSSLLEGLVWGLRSARDITAAGLKTGIKRYGVEENEIPPWHNSGTDAPDPALIQQDMSAIRHIMWNYVGLVRTARRLERAYSELRHLEMEIERFYRSATLTDDLIGLRNAVRSAIIVTTAAWENKRSVGCHYRE
ncbi:L-aspartate oxidase [Spirochaeta dissipatitropha]